MYCSDQQIRLIRFFKSF